MDRWWVVGGRYGDMEDAHHWLRRTVRRYVDRLIGAGADSATLPVSVAPQAGLVPHLLARCQALGCAESYLQLLHHFAPFLERHIPLGQLDQYVATALTYDGLSAEQRVAFASLRLRLLTQLGEHERAQAVLDETWADAQVDPHLLAELYIRQGVLSVSFGDYVAGEQAYEQGLALAQAHGDLARMSIIFNNRGNMAYALDRYTEAVDYYRQALEVAELLPDPIHRARAEGGLAMTLDELGRYQEAEQHYHAARQAAEAATDHYSLLSIELNMSHHAFLIEHYEEAKKRAGNALTLARRLGDWTRAGFALHNLGQACLGAGEYENASVHLRRALEQRLLLEKPLYIQTTVDVIKQLLDTVHADPTLDPSMRERIRQQCRQALEAVGPASGASDCPK
ncbi:MAG: tetratricopeptide repeat protein, partial [Chloroflexota bacterium]|nr:tetratricopeptide repeat protein [Chloroflexota bacterium]